MRPLKRPMFKTGGPIKEGVMNGLKDGGVATYMADATMMAGGGMPNMRGRVTGPGGYKGDKKLSAMDKLKYAGSGYLGTEGALGIMDLMRYLFNEGGKVGEGLVGDPRYPQQGGRAMHSQYLFPEIETSSAMPKTKLNIKSIKEIPKTPGQAKKKIIAGAAKKLFPNTNFEGIGSRGLGIFKNFFDKRISLPKFRRPGFQKQGPLYKVPALERAGNFIRNNKLLTGAGVLYGTPAAVGTAKFAIDKGPGIIKGILDPTGFYRDKYGKVKKALGFEEEKTPPPGKEPPPGAVIPKAKTQAEIDAEKAADDKKKLDRIYNLLGVKRAQANAASKALIDMSRYIDEGGKDVISKKNLGSTISKAIGAFDKRLDKADQLKEAAGLMMAKSEIEAMSDPYSKQYKKLSVEKLEKEARDSKDPRALKLALFDAKNKTLTHDGAVSLAKTNNPNAVVLADAEEAKDLGIGKDKSAIQYVQEQVVSQGGDVEGVYVVDKVIIKVDSQGNATQLLP